MTDTIKRPHKFVELKWVHAVFCEYCGLTVTTKSKSDNKSDQTISAKGCPCAPIQQEEKIDCTNCHGNGWIINGYGYTEDCGDCNGTGKT